MRTPTFTVAQNNNDVIKVSGNHKVNRGNSFQLSSSLSPAPGIHVYNNDGVDRCTSVVAGNHCPLPVNQDLTIKSDALKKEFRLGTSFATTSGSNGDLTVGSG